MAARFDPYAVLKALERHYVGYIVIGGFARVIHGTDELTRGLDIVPSTRPENIEQLDKALTDLNARREDGRQLRLEKALVTDPVLALETDRRRVEDRARARRHPGYDDLRRAVSREPLGKGVRPSVASTVTSRMLGALSRSHDLENLRMLRRLIELDRDLHRGRYIER